MGCPVWGTVWRSQSAPAGERTSYIYILMILFYLGGAFVFFIRFSYEIGLYDKIEGNNRS